MAKQSFVTGQVLTAQQVNDLQTNDFNQTVSAKTASYTLVAADKGTRLTMSSTSATTITVNTGLFAAGDTLFIQNLNTGVSTITAGTATVDTSASLALAQHEGGTLYFTSAGVATFFKAAGATPASGGLTYVGGASFSASSAVNVNDVFSATYDNYLLYVNIDSASTVASLDMRYRVSAADNTTSNYGQERMFAFGSSTAAGNVATGDKYSPVTTATDSTFFTYTFLEPFSTLKTKGLFHFSRDVGANQEMGTGTHVFNATTSFTGFSLFPASGTITGQFKVYGLANS